MSSTQQTDGPNDKLFIATNKNLHIYKSRTNYSLHYVTYPLLYKNVKFECPLLSCSFSECKCTVAYHTNHVGRFSFHSFIYDRTGFRSKYPCGNNRTIQIACTLFKTPFEKSKSTKNERKTNIIAKDVNLENPKSLSGSTSEVNTGELHFKIKGFPPTTKDNFSKENKLAVQHETPKAVKHSIGRRIYDGLMHTYHGFRLLFLDIRISTVLILRLMRGIELTRRESNLLRRTVGDIFRLIPFSIIIVVPFMEFLLPLILKLFPGILPSTFQTKQDKELKMKKQLRVKLEMAKFLQQTLSEFTQSGHLKCEQCIEDAKEFTNFFEKIRNGKGIATTKEIKKFSRLFKDSITLETMSRPQIIAFCRLLEIQPLGTTAFLRFQIMTRLRSLAADDRVIQKEGVESLNFLELQQACRARGMRALGVTKEELQQQLTQWIDLSINAHVPESLLLLSRAFILLESGQSATVQISEAISNLPAETALHVKANTGMDNKAIVQMMKSEFKLVREERDEIREEELRLEKEEKEGKLKGQKIDDNKQDHPYIKGVPRTVKGLLICRPAETVSEVVTPADVKTIKTAVESVSEELGLEKKQLVDLKRKLLQHKEEVVKIQEMSAKDKKESKAAKRLLKITNKMAQRLDRIVEELNEKEKTLIDDKGSLRSNVVRSELLKIDELINAIKKMQNQPNKQHLLVINEILSNMVSDKGEGTINVDMLLKVIDTLSKENIHLSKEQMSEVIDLIKKEELLNLEDKIEKTLLSHKAKNEHNLHHKGKSVESASEKYKVNVDAADETNRPKK